MFFHEIPTLKVHLKKVAEPVFMKLGMSIRKIIFKYFDISIGFDYEKTNQYYV